MGRYSDEEVNEAYEERCKQGIKVGRIREEIYQIEKRMNDSKSDMGILIFFGGLVAFIVIMKLIVG